MPHTEPELLSQAVAFDRKLQNQLRKGPAGEFLKPVQLARSLELLSDHEEYCTRLLTSGATNELLVDPNSITRAYGLPDMWDKSKATVEAELTRWGKDTVHPPIPEPLAETVSLDETRGLINLMWHEVLKVEDSLTARVYMTGAKDMYHLFWAPGAERLDYATPDSYNRATQFSFDLPHNVAHLAHLTALGGEQGALRYNDSMAQRAYFESVAVLSEYVLTDALAGDPKIGEGMARILNLDPRAMSASELTEWMIQDRVFEFKLRATRLYADLLMVEGSSFEDATHEISEKLGIPLSQAEAETIKYLPWTGLGAVYTHGYRKLLESGMNTVPSAVRSSDGGSVQSWSQV